MTKFCVTGQPFEYYLAAADGDYPKIASLLANDFNDYWWRSDVYKESRDAYKSEIKDRTSALRIEISKYLLTLDQSVAKASGYEQEVEMLARLNVDGVITTNWDLFLEEIFPDYKVYIGQEELLFSNPQEIGEIYKIHGCSSRLSSMVLTDDDYRSFNEKNAYLAAKLITLFVEHPILFIGYSISDENITSLLRSISKCIGPNNIEQLRKNLIFIERLVEGEEEGVSDTYITIDGIQIPLIRVKTNDLVPIYEAIDENKRKIPARVLRMCKEQLYELVKSATPEKKLSVVDIDELENMDDVEFVVGIGVAAQQRQFVENTIGGVGYKPITSRDLFNDLLHNDQGYDPYQVLTNVIPQAGKFSKNIPVFKYLSEVGIGSADEYEKSDLKLDWWVKRTINQYRMPSYSSPFEKKHSTKTMAQLIDECTAENAAAFIPYLEEDTIDLDLLLDFIIANEDKLNPGQSNYVTFYRKLASLYDRLRWGWE